MKNRKLFAILTLAAFMMTLLPVALFAATTDVNRIFTSVSADTDVVTADDDDFVKFVVYAYDNARDASAAGAKVYVASDRGVAIDDVFDVEGATVATTGNVYVFTTTGNDGKIEFKVKSAAVGTANFVFANNISYNGVDIYDRANGDTSESDHNLGVIAIEEVTFESSTDVTLELPASVATKIGNTTATVADSDASATKFKYDGGVPANGLDYYEVELRVTDGKNNPIRYADVDFRANKSTVDFDKTTVETNGAGYAKVKVYASKPDTYTITARAEGEKAEFNVVFATLGANNLEVVSGSDAVTALKEDFTIKLKLVDTNGNHVKTTAGNANAQRDSILFDVRTSPDGAKLDDADFNNTPAKVAADVSDDYLKLTIAGAQLNKEGNYEVRARLGTKYVDIPFTVKEQGDLVKMTVAYKQSAIGIDGQTSVPTVKLFDADGVSKEIDSDEVTWSISNSKIAKLSNVVGDEGRVIGQNDDDWTGEVTVTAIHEGEDLAAYATINVVLEPATFDVTVEDAAVGDDAVVTIQFIDGNGNAVAFGDSYAGGFTVDRFVTSKPADALVSTSANSTNNAKTLKEEGKATVKVSSDTKGEVVVHVVVKTGKTAGTQDLVFAKSATVNFGDAPADKVVYGAKNITMFIGSNGYVVDGTASTMDQAPFIQDNRTFVPVRMVATALGATNEDTMWDAATQTITLVREDLTVTMTIGSNVLTLSDGSTVVADVAPFIVAETGRTVLPFRAIAEAFGAEVEAVFAADGTVTAVTFQQ